MYEEAIAFQTVVENDVIKIPDEFQGKFRSPIWILATPTEQKKRHTKIIKPFTIDDFAPPTIKTKGWKFNREEANAR
ncbi:MAG: hypothetical protein LBR23_06785 [Spirochaetaceae bacterium]|jgi:hypothetical protein|nr:hypothetical protein [Spirochaetaceae bacterium]